MSFFATAAKGTEPALRDELRELGLPGVRADRGGVHFEGGLGEGALACLASRIAVRVLYELGSFDAADGDALYDGVRGVDWRAYLTADRTLAVRASCRSSALTHTQFIAQRTKDAVVDQLRGRTGERPSVDLADPDVALFVHLVRDRATLYVDLAGEPLHRRGYRRRNVTAPLKETLAAAILRLSGWDRRSPLLDPMCGSGTIAIEAALWAAGVAPGLARPRLGLERWAMHDEAGARAMADLRARLREPARREAPSIVASDHDPAAIEATTENARAAGVSISVLRRSLADLRERQPDAWLVTNPPYGERLPVTDELEGALARVQPRVAAILAGAPGLVRRRPARTFELYNGPIECRLLILSDDAALSGASPPRSDPAPSAPRRSGPRARRS